MALKKYCSVSIGILVWVLCTHCISSPDKPKTQRTAPYAENFEPTLFDTLNEQLRNVSPLSTMQLVQMGAIDTSQTTAALNANSYCDTLVYLNDSVYAAIISTNDTAGNCNYFHLITMNNKSRHFIASKYLHADCDVDGSWDSYERFHHAFISGNEIQLIKTTVFRKQDRSSPNEEDNIDFERMKSSFITIAANGSIH